MPMPDSSGELIVVGAGVVGLSTAVLLQERVMQPGDWNITVVADEFPTLSPPPSPSTFDSKEFSADYASMWAGAHYRPIPYLDCSHPSFSDLSDDHQRHHIQLAHEKGLALRTSTIMNRLARDDPQSGIQVVPAVEYLEQPPAENLALKTGDIYADPVDSFRVFDNDELDKVNRAAGSDGGGRVQWACAYKTYVINVHAYCAWLLQKFMNNGGKTVQKKLEVVSDVLVGLPMRSRPLIVNCSGMNMGRDPETKIIRGQTVLVKQQYSRTITRQCTDGTWSFLIPRPLGGGTIVGGTKQIGDRETQPRPEERTRLLHNAVRYFPDFVNNVDAFEIAADNVGRRPWRSGGLRIEIDEVKSHGSRVPVVHGYGAGGRGYELSWGIAEEICRLVERTIGQAVKL